MLRTEREQDRIFGGGRLQLEVELPAEPLAQRQTPRFVDAAAEGRVQDELHAARLIEEPFEHQRLLSGNDAKCSSPFGEVVDQLVDGTTNQARLTGEPA